VRPLLRSWSPFVAGLLVFLAGLALARTVEARLEAQQDYKTLATAQSLAASLQTAIRTRTKALESMAQRWAEDGVDERRFRRDTDWLVRNLEGYGSIALVEPEGDRYWIEPEEAQLGLEAGATWRTALAEMRATGRPVVSHAVPFAGGRMGFFVLVPVGAGGERLLLATFDVADFVEETFERFGSVEGYAVVIGDEGQTIFSDVPEGVETAALRWRSRVADVVGIPWSIELAPLPDRLEDEPQHLPALTIPAGLAIGLLLAAAIRSALVARARAAEAEAVRRGLEAEMEERERVTEALHRSEELYKTLAAHVPDAAVLLFDPGFRVLLAEGPLLRRLGLHRRPLDGTPLTELLPEIVAADLLPRYAATLEGIAQDAEVRWGKRWFHVRTAPVRGEQGAIYAGLALATEISERKKAEEELRESARRLERSNRELQDFAYIASHDLQEPLRKVQAFGERLQRRHGAALDEQGRDYLERMMNAAARMRALLEGLLGFSRVTTNGRPFERCDLALVARQVLSDLEVRIEETGAKVELGSLPTIVADPLQMRQLLQNLLSNALKFHEPGKAPHVRVEARLEAGAEGTVCILEVADDGIGFDEKYLDRIFAVFQRLHGRGVYEGSGVGLAICRKIAERHGGEITARSAPGQGATFLVRLPVGQPDGEPADAAA